MEKELSNLTADDALNLDLRFVNAVEMNENHPSTYQIPPVSYKKMIRAGMCVKVAIESERFWVLVTENNIEKQLITGIVNNDLFYTDRHGYKFKDIVVIKWDNVMNILAESKS